MSAVWVIMQYYLSNISYFSATRPVCTPGITGTRTFCPAQKTVYHVRTFEKLTKITPVVSLISSRSREENGKTTSNKERDRET